MCLFFVLLRTLWFLCSIWCFVAADCVNGGVRPQQVMIWDDHQAKCIGELSFRSQVGNCSLRRVEGKGPMAAAAMQQAAGTPCCLVVMSTAFSKWASQCLSLAVLCAAGLNGGIATVLIASPLAAASSFAGLEGQANRHTCLQQAAFQFVAVMPRLTVILRVDFSHPGALCVIDILCCFDKKERESEHVM